MAEKVTMMKLKVDLQCGKCYKKVKNLLCKFPQIRDQKYDEKQNTVTITVASGNPEKIRDKLCCKGGGCIRSIEIVEPPKPEPPPVKPSKKPEKPAEPKQPEKPKPPPPPEKSKEKPPQTKPEPRRSAPKPPEQPVLGCPPAVPPLVAVPIGACYVPWYKGWPGGPCYKDWPGRPCFKGYCGPPRPPCYCYGYYCGSRPCYVSRCN